MSILINSGNDQKLMRLSFDIYGNLYIHDKIDSAYTHQVNINGKDIPYLESDNYDIINKYEGNLGTFMLLDMNNSLKHKIIKKKEIIKEEDRKYMEENGIYNSDDEYDLDGDDIIDYYTEEHDHVINEEYNNEDEYLDEDNINAYGYDNLKFTFWNNSSNDPIPIYNRNDCDIMALYDVYIYENDNLIFKSKSSDNSSIYRFKINTNGDIYFRSIGDNEKKFNIISDGNNMMIFNELLPY